MAQINKPTDYFNTVLYTGNDSVRTITTGLTSTDFIWNKRRDNTGNHMVYDVVRGVNKDINTDSTEAEETQAGTVTAFGSNSYTLGTHGGTNYSGETRVSWNWAAGGAGSSNTDGSITSTVSANTTSGFSIVSYTGTGANATVGHGLGAVPKMIIAKNLDSSGGSAEHWTVFHHTLDTNKNLYLNLTNAEDTPSPEIYRKGSFTNDVFAIGAHDRINKSGEGMIAYCFAEKKGFSKFGSYTGNGNADGPFIYTGFKPAFVITKVSSGSTVQGWLIRDNKRDTFNVSDTMVPANSNSADVNNASSYGVDLLSNGFKIRGTDGGVNQNGGTLIYMAFAEEPLVGTNNIPATAR